MRQVAAAATRFLWFQFPSPRCPPALPSGGKVFTQPVRVVEVHQSSFFVEPTAVKKGIVGTLPISTPAS